jgi:hypothetical protein
MSSTLALVLLISPQTAPNLKLVSKLDKKLNSFSPLAALEISQLDTSYYYHLQALTKSILIFTIYTSQTYFLDIIGQQLHRML